MRLQFDEFNFRYLHVKTNLAPLEIKKKYL